ncbi:MAG: hypothetical protein A2Y10_18155 [Planctomycetes bacterium GWF2_41_51]|nr:MAG: hypothetical protein A2Y10_18155 [Planctomycetes bacterium GWF2_41_51]
MIKVFDMSVKKIKETCSTIKTFIKQIVYLLKKFFQILFIRKARECFIRYNKALIQSIKNNNYEGAIEEYKSILESGYPFIEEYLVYKQLGVVYSWNCRFEESEVALRKALELYIKAKKHSGELYRYLGYANLKQGKFEDALFFYEKAIQYGKKGKLNKWLTNLEDVKEMKDMLEVHRKDLPFLTIYYEQNKSKFKK